MPTRLSQVEQVVVADAREVLRAAAAAHVSGLSGRPPVMAVGAMSPVTSTERTRSVPCCERCLAAA